MRDVMMYRARKQVQLWRSFLPGVASALVQLITRGGQVGDVAL